MKAIREKIIEQKKHEECLVVICNILYPKRIIFVFWKASSVAVTE